MRVSELTRPKPVEATIDLGDGDSIMLVFDRNRVTPAWVTLAQQRDEEQDTLSLPKALADVIVSWDVTGDDGGEFPPTAENIAVLSFPAQSELLQRIMAQAVPSRAEGNSSPAPTNMPPSDSVEPVLPPQNGLVTSPLPSDSAAASLR